MSARIGRLHVITDYSLQRRWSHVEIARQAAAGGADVVQFREKMPVSTLQLVRTARELLRAVQAPVQVVVDDRADVAVVADADGVHVGRHDLSPGSARAIVGAGRLVGGTANGVDEARRCFAEPLDYIGVGPVFGTTCKKNPAPRLGLEFLAQIARESPLPVIAIGGIGPEHVPVVMECGVHGIAVLSGVVCAADPMHAVERYRKAMESCVSEWMVKA
jgi:thiamine-phosphate pyrophosphorylase